MAKVIMEKPYYFPGDTIKGEIIFALLKRIKIYKIGISILPSLYWKVNRDMGFRNFHPRSYKIDIKDLKHKSDIDESICIKKMKMKKYMLHLFP